jgi:type IV secretory pathway VirB2 component (pilin)
MLSDAGLPNVSSASGGAILSALEWCVSVLLGAVGSSLAILGVAGLGVALLQGHLPYRRAVKMVLGIFILFGSPAIARGLLEVAGVAGASTWSGEEAQRPAAAPSPLPSAPAVNPDPYAGAAMPTQP